MKHPDLADLAPAFHAARERWPHAPTRNVLNL